MAKPKTSRIVVTVTEETVQWIDAVADAVEQSRSQVVRDVLEATLPILKSFKVSAEGWPVNRFDLYEELATIQADNGDKLVELFRTLKEMTQTPGSVITGVTPSYGLGVDNE